MKTLNELITYARMSGMSDRDIDRLISEVETDGNGNVIAYNSICFGIDCNCFNAKTDVVLLDGESLFA